RGAGRRSDQHAQLAGLAEARAAAHVVVREIETPRALALWRSERLSADVGDHTHDLQRDRIVEADVASNRGLVAEVEAREAFVHEDRAHGLPFVTRIELAAGEQVRPDRAHVPGANVVDR